MAVKQKCVEMVFAVFGKFIHDKHLSDKEKLAIETLAGVKYLQLFQKNGNVESVCVDMGEPILEPEKIPMHSDEQGSHHVKLKLEETEFEFTGVSMGNPHAVTFVKEVSNFPVEKYGKIVEIDKHFPNRVNVEFVQIIDETHLKMRVWEKGSAETMACGTGTCATVVASILNGYTKRKVEVELLGGILEIEWKKEDNHVYMKGPAVSVFEGYMEV